MGTNLTSRDLQLVHDGVTYTPLQSTQEDFFFLLGSNGTNVITVNGRWLCTIVVEGVEVPEGFPRLLRMSQRQVDVESPQLINTVEVRDFCINYAFKINTDYPSFRLRVGGPSAVFADAENFVCFNCNGIVTVSPQSTYVTIDLSVVDDSLPAYVEYKGFICAVFNYSD